LLSESFRGLLEGSLLRRYWWKHGILEFFCSISSDKV